MLKKIEFFILPIIFIFIGMQATLSWGEVNVYAEGTCTESDVQVHLYVNVTSDPILSYGVKLTYDPTEINSPSVVKDKDIWYFGGPGDAALETPGADPDTSIPGEVVILGGKIDESAPFEGVIGYRKSIAVVSFTRENSTKLPDIGLQLGRAGTYANFVTTSGNVLDGSKVVFSPVSFETDPDPIEKTTIVLTDKSPNLTILAQTDALVFGTVTPNQVTLASGAQAELRYFPGENTIQIQSSSDLFTIFRSGAVVTFQGSDGTVLMIPATTERQSIEFSNGSVDLYIDLTNDERSIVLEGNGIQTIDNAPQPFDLGLFE